jgi:guanosine-3',5'-bis(diphosphate) 3'-pyrophosphohydrolase
MTDSASKSSRLVLHAISFAARAKQGPMRKDRATPYASHVFRVCMVVRHVFGIDDPRVLTAAVLHDAIEDTTTDFDDVEEAFGAEIAGWVAALSKDKRAPFDNREEVYCQRLTSSPWQVQVCKLADVFDNLLDMGSLGPKSRPRTLANKRRYLDAIEANLQPEARQAWAITHQLWRDLASPTSSQEQDEASV